MANAAPCRQTRYNTEEVAVSRNESKDATSKAPVQAQVTLGASHTAGIHNHRKVRHEGKNTARPQRTLLVCANLGNISNRRQFLFLFYFILFFYYYYFFRHTKQIPLHNLASQDQL